MSNPINLTDPEVLFELNGGRRVAPQAAQNFGLVAAPGAAPIRDFGWRRTPANLAAALQAVPFQEEPNVPVIGGDRVFLWEFILAANQGRYCPLNWQLTGSCVMAGFTMPSGRYKL